MVGVILGPTTSRAEKWRGAKSTGDPIEEQRTSRERERGLTGTLFIPLGSGEKYPGNAPKMADRIKFRNCCFTSFVVQDVKWNAVEMEYLVYQEEVSPETKRHHIQGFVQFKRQLRLPQIRILLGDPVVHVEKMRGTPEEASAYCKKEDSRAPGGRSFEGGELRKAGKRADIGAFIEAAKEAVTLGKRKMDLLEDHASVLARHSRFADEVFADLEEKDGKAALVRRFEDARLRTWQSDLLDDLRDEPDDRKVIWVTDEAGGCGKSWFARYCLARRSAVVLQPARFQDMAYIWSQRQSREVFIDCSRTAAPVEASKWDPMAPCYALAEALKNGLVQSTKYQPRTVFSATPHVVFLANFAPDLAALSADRWDVRSIRENKFVEI